MQEVEKIKRIREKMPAVEQIAYLNAGTCGPMPLSCSTIIRDAVEKELGVGRASIPGYKAFADQMEALRVRLARWIGGNADEITITSNTTEGMNIVLWGLQWQPGDEIITSTEEHHGLLAPLAMLHQRYGVNIRYLPFCGDPGRDTYLLKDAITPRTRMLAISEVLYTNSTLLKVRQLSDICREKGVAVLIDGAQSMGAIPVDVQELGVDFFAAPGQKWLCGPEGMGFLYVRRDWISRLSPTFAGIFGIRNVSWFDQVSPYFVPEVGARRYQCGGFFRPLVAAFDASLQFLEEEVGLSWMWKRIANLTKRLRDMLQQIPEVTILTPLGCEAGMLTICVDGEPAVLRDQLEEKGVLIRDIPGEIPMLRVSVGFYNNEQDLQRFCDTLQSLCSQ